tara:strand:+ start:130199 stop:131098 length:900 start_codon:yes stop_codon:yes gene_type:complete
MSFPLKSILVMSVALLHTASFAQTNSTTTTNPSVTQEPSKYDTTLLIEQAVSGESLNDGTADEGGGASFVQVRYKFDKLNHFRVRQYLEHFYNSDKEEMDGRFGDTVLQYDRKKWFSVSGLDFAGSTRLYLPTGKVHSETGETQLRGYLSTRKPVTKKLTASFESSPRFYRYNKNKDVRTVETFPVNPNSKPGVQAVPTTTTEEIDKRFLKWNNRLGASYKIASNFTAMAHFLVSHESFYNQPNYNISKAGMDFLFIVDFNETFSSELFVESITRDWDKGADFFEADDTNYYLSLVANF